MTFKTEIVIQKRDQATDGTGTFEFVPYRLFLDVIEHNGWTSPGSFPQVNAVWQKETPHEPKTN